MEIKLTRHNFYKGKFLIVFYDEEDENLKFMFDNVREILKYQKKEINRKNVNRINIEIYLALRKEGHFTRMLNGERLRVYLINLKEGD